MKKSFLLCTGILSFLISIAQDSSYAYKPKYSVVFDIANGKGLLTQFSRDTPGDISDLWKPSDGERKTLEDNFKKILNLPSSGCCIPRLKIRNLESYGYQYTGVTIRGKKYIYINAFPLGSKQEIGTFIKGWEKDPIIVFDGGDGYWGALFSIDDKEFSQLSFNGMG